MGAYDFWAVAENCCTPHTEGLDRQAKSREFTCAGWDSHTARSAVRMVREDLQPYYRLATDTVLVMHSNLKLIHVVFFFRYQFFREAHLFHRISNLQSIVSSKQNRPRPFTGLLARGQCCWCGLKILPQRMLWRVVLVTRTFSTIFFFRLNLI